MNHAFILFGFVLFLANLSAESNGLALTENIVETVTDETPAITINNNQTLLNETRLDNLKNDSLRNDYSSKDIVSKIVYENDSKNEIYVTSGNTAFTNEIVEPEALMNNDVHDANDQSLKILSIPDTNHDDVASALEENIRSSVKDEIKLEQKYETAAIDVIDDIPDLEVRQTLTKDLMAMEYPQGLKEDIDVIQGTDHPDLAVQEDLTGEPATDLKSAETTTVAAIITEDFSTTLEPTEDIVHIDVDNKNESDKKSIYIRQMRGFNGDSETNEISIDSDSNSKDTDESNLSKVSEDSNDSEDSVKSKSEESSLDEPSSNSLDSSNSDESKHLPDIDINKKPKDTDKQQTTFINHEDTRPAATSNLTVSTDIPLEITSEEMQQVETTQTTMNAIESITESIKDAVDGILIPTNHTEPATQNHFSAFTTEKMVSKEISINATDEVEFVTIAEVNNLDKPQTPSTWNDIKTSPFDNHIQRKSEIDIKTTKPLLSVTFSKEPVEQVPTNNNSLLEEAVSAKLEVSTHLGKQSKLLSVLNSTEPMETSTDSTVDKTTNALETEPIGFPPNFETTDVAPEQSTQIDANRKSSPEPDQHPNSILNELYPNVSTEAAAPTIQVTSTVSEPKNLTTPTMETTDVVFETSNNNLANDQTESSNKLFAVTEDPERERDEGQMPKDALTARPDTDDAHQYPPVPPFVNHSVEVDDQTTDYSPTNLIGTHKDETAAVSDEVISPAVAGQNLNVIVAEGLGKPLPTRSVNDEPSTSSYSSENETATVTVICLTVSVVFVALSVALYLITFQRHHGTLDIEMQEQRCGKDDLNDDEDAETRVTLLHQLPSVDSDEQSLD